MAVPWLQVRDALRVLGKGVTLTGPQAAATAGMLSAVQGIQRTVSRAMEEERSGALAQAQASTSHSRTEQSTNEASLLHILERQVRRRLPFRGTAENGLN